MPRNRSCPRISLYVVAGIVVLAVLAGAAWHVFWVLPWRREESALLEKEIQFVRELGHPLIWDEFVEWYGEVPEDQNAAPLLYDTFSAYHIPAELRQEEVILQRIYSMRFSQIL